MITKTHTLDGHENGNLEIDFDDSFSEAGHLERDDGVHMLGVTDRVSHSLFYQ
jgi:hypothetical protein